MVKLLLAVLFLLLALAGVIVRKTYYRLPELIDKLQQQSDSRFTPEELEIAKRALTFGELAVSDALIPRKAIKILKSDDTVGPILIDEVVKGGEPYALVRDTKGGPFTG